MREPRKKERASEKKNPKSFGSHTHDFLKKSILAIVSVILFFSIIELTLFLAGFNYAPVSYSVNTTTHNTVFVPDGQGNLIFGPNHYNGALPSFRWNYTKPVFRIEKPKGTYRIMLLGGSSTANFLSLIHI